MSRPTFNLSSIASLCATIVIACSSAPTTVASPPTKATSTTPDSTAASATNSTPSQPACGPIGATCSASAGCCSNDCSHGICAIAAAASGALDGDYGSQGCVTLAYAGDPRNYSRANAAALDGSGNLFLVGGTETDGVGESSASESGWFTVLGPTGTATTSIAITPTFGHIYNLALSPTGAPTLFGDGLDHVMRTNAVGTPDPSFTLSVGSAGTAGFGPAYQSTGALLFTSGSVLTRVTSSGTLDSTFGAGGSVDFATVDMPLSLDSFALDASNRIYVAGRVSINGITHWMLGRFSPDGVLDTTFAAQGFADAGPAPHSPNGAQIVLRGSQAGTDFYLVGADDDENLSYSQVWVVHAGPSGVDSAYGTGGHVAVSGPAMTGQPPNLYTNEYPNFNVVDAAVQSDGKLVLTGRDSFGLDWFVTRLDKDGAVDSTYGTNGWIDTSANSPQVGPGDTVYGPIAVRLASGGGAIVIEERQHSQNLYVEASAIVCKYTP